MIAFQLKVSTILTSLTWHGSLVLCSNQFLLMTAPKKFLISKGVKSDPNIIIWPPRLSLNPWFIRSAHLMPNTNKYDWLNCLTRNEQYVDLSSNSGLLNIMPWKPNQRKMKSVEAKIQQSYDLQFVKHIGVPCLLQPITCFYRHSSKP